MSLIFVSFIAAFAEAVLSSQNILTNWSYFVNDFWMKMVDLLCLSFYNNNVERQVQQNCLLVPCSFTG